MKGGTILLIVGLLLGYLAVSGKYKCLTYLVQCVGMGPESCNCGSTVTDTSVGGNVSVPTPKTYKEPAYEGPGPVSYNIPMIGSFA